jgi:hypothetical protein
MFENKNTRLVRLPPRLLLAEANRLTKGVPLLQGTLFNAVMQKKKLARSEKNKRAAHARLWKPIISAAKYERRNVRVMHDYQASLPEQTPRLEALGLYLVVLDKVIEQLEAHIAVFDYTPAQYAKEHNLPNGGVHWSDWVKESHKRNLHAVFAALPKTGRKQKFPFARTVPKPVFEKQHAQLLRRTMNEAVNERRRLDDDPTDAAVAAKYEQIKKVYVLLKDMKEPQPLPNTWHGLAHLTGVKGEE